MSKSIISAIAVLTALAFSGAALAQDASASTAAGGSASAQAGDNSAAAAAGASTSAQAGDNGGGGASTSAEAGSSATGATTSTDVSASASQADGGSTNVGIQTDVNVNVTTQQTTEIKQVIVQQAPAALNVNFSVNLGTIVPADVKVKLAPLPARVVEIVPQFKGYLFFVLADGRIVIVAPDTLKIVAILTV